MASAKCKGDVSTQASDGGEANAEPNRAAQGATTGSGPPTAAARAARDASLLGQPRAAILCDYEKCGKSGATARCSSCKSMIYCNRECQRGAWQAHKRLCKVMAENVRQEVAAVTEAAAKRTKGEPMVPTVDIDAADKCAVCLEAPEAPVHLECRHTFCYDCIGSTQAHGYREAGEATATLPCPLCRQPTVPMDILGIFTQPADLRLRLHDKIDSHVEDFGPGAAEAKAELLTEAAAVVDAALDVGKDPDSHHLDPFYVSALHKRGRIAFAAGDYKRGVELMTTAVQLYQPDRQFAYTLRVQTGRDNLCNHYLLLAKCSIGDGNMEQALRALDKAAECYGDVPDPKMQRQEVALRSRVLYELGQYREAIAVGELAIYANRHYPDTHKWTALAFRALGELEAAVTILRQAVVYEAPWDQLHVDTLRDLLEAVLTEAAAVAAPETEES